VLPNARHSRLLSAAMSVHPLAGKPAPAEILIDPEQLLAAYYSVRPDPENPEQQVAFGTSGHRGSPADGSFNEAHILATTQAICEYRAGQGITGPLYLGRDTHSASEPAERSALEVLAANGVETVLQAGGAYTATPGISHAIIVHNRGRKAGLADGIVVTPSHNPPRDGGFKYNPPHGGPADTDATGWIQDRANALLRENNGSVKRLSYEAAKRAATTHEVDFAAAYVADLENVVDIAAIRNAKLRLGADPLGGASIAYWSRIAEHYKLDISVVNPAVRVTPVMICSILVQLASDPVVQVVARAMQPAMSSPASTAASLPQQPASFVHAVPHGAGPASPLPGRQYPPAPRAAMQTPSCRDTASITQAPS